MPYVAAITDNVIVTRDGELLASVALHGLSAETSDPAEVNALAARFEAIVAQTQGAVAFYVNRISVRSEMNLRPIKADTLAGVVDTRWAASFADRTPYKRQIMITVGIRSAVTEGVMDVLSRNTSGFADTRDRLVTIVNAIADDLVHLYHPIGARRLTLSSGEWLGFLSAINTGEYQLINPTGLGTPLAAQTIHQDILFKRDHFRFQGPVSGRDRFGTVLSMKQYPNPTAPGIYDGLDIAEDMVVTHSFIPIPTNIAQERAASKARQMRSAADAAKSLEYEIDDIRDALASGDTTLGSHHFSVAIFGDSLNHLKEVVDYVRRATAINGGVSVGETYAQRSVFFAQHPGNQSYRPRVAPISNINFAQMAAFHNRPVGSTRNIPWGVPLTHFRTQEDEVFAFNLHAEMTSRDELTPGHTLILGETGAGKSLLATFLIAQAQRCGARTFAFDYKQGMEVGMRALGISYSTVKVGETTGLNPFLSEIDEAGRAWLANWIESLVTRHQPITAMQRNAIAEAVKENAAAASDQPLLSTFDQFVTFFRALDDDGDLAGRFEEWVGDGRFAWLFDGTGADPLSDPSQSICFDLTDIFEDRTSQTAWLAYVFRRIERLVDDGKPTLILMDEAPRLLDDAYFAQKIKSWLDVMRKQNAAVILLAQRAAQIRDSAVGSTITSACNTKLVFQHNAIDAKAYLEIGFTEPQVRAMKVDAPNRHIVLITPQDELVLDVDLSALGPALQVLAGGKSFLSQLPDDWKTDPAFWRPFI